MKKKQLHLLLKLLKMFLILMKSLLLMTVLVTIFASWRDVSERGEAWLAEYLERERAATGSPRLRSGYNRAFGYYLEIGRTGLETVPPHFERRQTLVNAERFVTPELRDF